MAVLHLTLPDQSSVVLAFPDGGELHERAVSVITDVFANDATVDALIADAIVDGASRRRPGWSPTTVMTDPTELSLVAVRVTDEDPFSTGALHERIACAARLHERGAAVVHVPAPLVTATRERIDERAQEAVSHFAAGHYRGAGVVAGDRRGSLRLVPPLPAPITAIIPTAGTPGPDGVPMVGAAIRAVLEASATTSVVVVIGDEYAGDPLVDDPRVEVVRRAPGPFNFSTAVNTGILHATTDLVLLLNDDVSSAGSDWLDQMAVHLGDPSVGVVGALLQYPDESIQHAGVVLDDARPLHSFVGQAVDDLRAHHCDVARDVLAVTGACLLLRRADALTVGGFSTEFPLSFNDIDFCLKMRRLGRRVILEPAARLVHHESATRQAVTEPWEWDRYIGRWGHVQDPWYHPGHDRPDDPHNLARNADHLDPGEVPFLTEPRGTSIECRVHHSRIPDAG